MKKLILALCASVALAIAPATTAFAEETEKNLINEITENFIYGDWKVKEFLGFQMITTEDIEYPDGEKIIGKVVNIASNLFSTKDFGPEYEKYVSHIWLVEYSVVEEFSGDEFAAALKVSPDVTKIKSEDHVTLIQAGSVADDQYSPMLVSVNNERLLMYINCGYFELGKNIWFENDMDISIYDSAVYNDSYYHVFYHNNAAEKIPENENIYLFMINGGFMPYSGVKIVDGRAVIPVKIINEILGHSAEDMAETVIIDGVQYAPLRLSFENAGAEVDYIEDLDNIKLISVEIAEKQENTESLETPSETYSPEDGILKVKYASDAEYQVLVEYFKLDGRSFDDDIYKDYDPLDIVFTGTSYGRYYVYRLNAFPQYNIFFNKYTGEIFSQRPGLPFLNISEGFINISWLYQ